MGGREVWDVFGVNAPPYGVDCRWLGPWMEGEVFTGVSCEHTRIRG